MKTDAVADLLMCHISAPSSSVVLVTSFQTQFESRTPAKLLLVLALAAASGCVSHRPPASSSVVGRAAQSAPQAAEDPIVLISHQVAGQASNDGPAAGSAQTPPPVVISSVASSTATVLEGLEAIAETSNPSLQRLRKEATAARAKASYLDKLPDPTVGANVFANPIETASGSYRANLTVMQMLPSLARLDAQAQQACFEALALQQVYAAERLKVIGDIRAMWFRLYVVAKQIEISRSDQQRIELLMKVANAKLFAGEGAPGDVYAATLEYSRLEEQLVTSRQQLASTKAELNRLAGRDAAAPIATPSRLDASLPDWSHEALRQLAWENQPDIAAAQIRTQATRWGVEVARLKRRPDLSLSASWFAIDDNRPPSAVVHVGEDAWSLGASVSVPLWHEKYDAMQREAQWRHSASHEAVEEVVQRYDAVLRDLWEQAKSAHETAMLYRETILPQAERTLESDRQSYSNGAVEFDRVIRDFRNLVTLEIGYHRAVGQLATSLARIQQATGTPLEIRKESAPPSPDPLPPPGDRGV